MLCVFVQVTADMIYASGPYNKTLPTDCMPFVNRYHEVFDLLRVNVDNCSNILVMKDIDDYRTLKLPICGQMFGSGKTTIAKNWIRKLSDPRAVNYIKT
jgi:hypothetical protein